MEFVKANAFRGKGRLLAIFAVLAVVASCLAIAIPADAEEVETLYIHGALRSSIIGSESQIIIVDDDLTVREGQFVEANNNFTVNEGVTLTLDSGSYVKIASGTADIKGKVVCAGGTVEQPTFVVDNGASISISGDVSVNGPNAFVLAEGATASVSGNMTIAENGTASLEGVTVKNGGKLTIASVDEGTYLNGLTAESGSAVAVNGVASFKGLTIQDGSSFVVSPSGSLKQIAGADAALVNNGTFTNNGAFVGNIVNDKAVVADSDEPSSYYVEALDKSTFESKNLNGTASFRTGNDLQLQISNVEGVVVAADGESVALAGIPANGGEAGIVTVAGTKVQFNDDMTFPADVNVVLEPGSALLVTSYVTMIQNTATAPITGTGTLTVTGTVQTAVPLVIKSKTTPGIALNAVYYMKDNYHFYTTFDKALAANPDYIKVYGDIVFDSDTVIPKGMTIDMTEANSITITNRATVTVKDGGVFRNGTIPIDVQGTLILENTPTSETNVSIVNSDVLVESGIMTKFTNLKRALEEAQPGDVIYIKRNHVYISEDTVIPKDVTLKIGSGNTVEVINGAKLTVNGMLDAHPGNFVITSGSTVVNGCFVFDAPFSAYSSQIAGAYFTNGGVNTIAPLSYIAGKESTIGSIVEMYGDNSVGDVTLMGAGKTIFVRGGAFEAGTLSLSGFDFNASEASSVSGKIAIGNGSVTLAKAKNVVLTKSAEGGVLVSSAIDAASSDASATLSGLARVNANIAEGVNVLFASDADVSLTNDYTFYKDIVIPEGAKVTAEKGLTAKTIDVAGTLVADIVVGDKISVAQTGSTYTAQEGKLPAMYDLSTFNVDGKAYCGDNTYLKLDTLMGDGKVILGDDSRIEVTGDVVSLDTIEAGNNLSISASNIFFGNASLKDGAKLVAKESIKSDGTVDAGNGFTATAGDKNVFGDVNAGDNASFTGKEVAISGVLKNNLIVKATEKALIGAITAGDNANISADTATVDTATFGNDLMFVIEKALTEGTIEAGNNSAVAAESIDMVGIVLGNGSGVSAFNDLSLSGESAFGTEAEIGADNITVGKLTVAENSNITAFEDITFNDVSALSDNVKVTAQDMNVNGALTVTPATKIVLSGALDVDGSLKAIPTNSEAAGSLSVAKDAAVSGEMDLTGMKTVAINGDLDVYGSAVIGASEADIDVLGAVRVASSATLGIVDGSSFDIGKDLSVGGTLNVGSGSSVVVGTDAKGAVDVTGNIVTGVDSAFRAAALSIPGTFTNSGDVVIGSPEVGGTSTIPGTIDAKDGSFVMYQTVYVYGSILTEAGSFAASKLFIGVNESIFGTGVAPATSTPVIGSNVTITPDGVAYVSPAVKTNGAFSGFDFTRYYKGDNLYLVVYADPDNYVDTYTEKGKSLRRNIDSIYASADDAYVNGWRATKNVKNAAEAASARVYDPYGTHESVWLNCVYDIYNFKLYVADETATPMVGKLVDGNTVPLTLAKTGLNCYESPVNLTAGTYRVALTYALGHEDEYIDNPLVVNGVPQSTYDFTFSGNPDNEELVSYLLQFSFEEDEPPIVVEPKSMSLTDILLIVIVILIILVAVAVILRARRA
ncbi:MAG: hypothetical protein IKQ60_08555 [Candidatus Methanomethylophilaceae archaeon]|nr:hypothetical protein [Candidatus Methanomethylophilaceae archaeon]